MKYFFLIFGGYIGGFITCTGPNSGLLTGMIMCFVFGGLFAFQDSRQ